MTACIECGKTVGSPNPRALYCSEPCGARFRERRRIARATEMAPSAACPECGGMFKVTRQRQTYCSLRCASKVGARSPRSVARMGISRAEWRADRHFWPKVRKTDGCWEWTGLRDRDGYGFARQRGKSVRAHRLSFELATGIAPGAMCVCHTCDNPWCVRPEHLFLGTNADNMADKVRKGRARAPFGETHPHHRLSAADVIEIRRRKQRGESAQAIAAAFSISPPYVNRLARGDGWRHLGPAPRLVGEGR